MNAGLRNSHTPGPWSFSQFYEGSSEIRPSKDSGLTVKGWSYGFRPIAKVLTLDKRLIVEGRAEANARLIAAAPELLTALREIEYFAPPSSLSSIKAIAATAIAKATGSTS